MDKSGPTVSRQGDAVIEEAAAPFFDTRSAFEKWLQSLTTSSDTQAPDRLEGVGSSHSEVLFDGILRVDGFLRGNIRSAYGTLVMTNQGRIEADVDVRIAIIDGYLEGNLRATEHVVLNPSARVAGNIHTPSLSIRDGAVFEGTSFFLERSVYSEISARADEVELVESMAVGA